MRALLLIVVLQSLSVVLAQLEISQRVFRAETGAFVSIPVTTDAEELGGAELEVIHPGPFQVVGSPRLQEGFGLVNLLVGREALAGEHEITIRTVDPPSTVISVTVRVAPNRDVEVRVPQAEPVVRGESVEYEIALVNTGNAPLPVLIDVTAINLQVLPFERRLELAVGETREVTVSLMSGDRAGDAGVYFWVTSPADPNLSEYAVIRTEVLAFAGAGAIDGPALSYRLDARSTYSGTLGYGASAELFGPLSDYVRTEVDLAFDGSDRALRGQAVLSGGEWLLGYGGTEASHRLEGRYETVSGTAAISDSGYGVGVRYRPAPFELSASHVVGAGNRQTITAGYRFQVSPNVGIAPGIGVTRLEQGSRAIYTPVLVLGADLRTFQLLADADLTLPLSSSGRGWRASAAVSSRLTDPLRISSEVAASEVGVTGSATLSEEVSDEVILTQSLAYEGSSRLTLGVRYRPLLQPITVRGSVGADYDAAGLELLAGVGADYSFESVLLNADVRGSSTGDLSYGGAVGYRAGSWSTEVGYSSSGTENAVHSALQVATGGLTARALYRYGFTSTTHEGELDLQYTTGAGHGFFATLDLAEELSWEVGANLVVTGGFAVPSGIVDVFGGRSLGIVTGRVFFDEDRDGQLDEAENRAAGVTVTNGLTGITADVDGHYRLALAPGSHRLTVTGAGASWGLPQRPFLAVAPDQTVSLDLPLEQVGTMVVTVYNDTDRDGLLDQEEFELPRSRVVATGPNGVTTSRISDGRGEALFASLIPGRYLLELDGDSLPPFFESGGPVTIEVAAGPIIRPDLAAWEGEREVVRTLTVGDLTLLATIEPARAPAGADLLVMADVSGEPEAVYASADGTTIQLEPVDDRFQGRLPLPVDGQGVLLAEIVAIKGELERRQTIPVVVVPGPLAEVSASPTIVGASELVRVEARFLKMVERASVSIAGAEYELHRQDNPYVFALEVLAPRTAASYSVELLADGEVYARTRFRVSE